MKKVVIIVLIVLAAVAFLIVPLIRNNDDSDTRMASEFTFEGFPAVPYGKRLPVAFQVNSNDVKKIELVYNDSVFNTWNAPKGNQKFIIDAGYYGVGARNLILRSYMKDGNVEEDTRLVRVLSDISPQQMKAEVVASYPHDRTSYTQGLEFSNGQLYEGTGNPQSGLAASIVGKIDLQTGAIAMKNGLDATYFGEGITILGDRLYQLTWKNGKCFVYDKNDLTLQLKEFSYTGEGWGLCNDGKNLIMSDGTERLYFRDPNTFDIVRTIEVYHNLGPQVALNELEYIDGKIYANVYTTNQVVVIEPGTGRVLEIIDAAPLEAAGKLGGEVLNGIAWNPDTKKLYMTGKYWGKLMEVKIVPY
jgi:glutaminyl-peptide cyclotransferase